MRRRRHLLSLDELFVSGRGLKNGGGTYKPDRPLESGTFRLHARLLYRRRSACASAAIAATSSGYRCVPLKRYPHLVYRVEAGDVDVWCVLHAKRDIPHSMQEPDNHLPVGFCHVFKLQTHGRKHAA
jgi:hypothetical protein